MAAVDFARLRNQTMNDGQDSEVTVNTRALIDKVLARYSSEHTTLRELIQNASDAGANKVIIKYETDPSLNVPAPQTTDDALLLKHVIQHHTLKRLIVSNNGQPFTLADWNRLKSIADGNPDETKIGAFGVGFYSVFADCDEPFVVSGDRTMAFYWKGNTLSTRVAVLGKEQSSSDTTFFLDYRQANPESPSYSPSRIPNLPTLCQFLCTSLTFVGLQTIELQVDDFTVASFEKKISPPSDVKVPTGLRTETEGGLMRVASVTGQHSQISADWMNVIATAQNPPKRTAERVQAEVKQAGTTLKSFFSKFSSASSSQPAMRAAKPAVQAPERVPDFAENVSGESRGIIFLQVCTVEVNTKVTSKFSAEIERATKKPPPKKTKIALLTSPYQDASYSLSTSSGTTAQLSLRIFSDILPTKAGRIFIGFPTAQTTGFLAHVSAPSLIPTVERENVDMNARYIKDWNTELLRVAGLACRITYASEMAEIGSQTEKKPLAELLPKAKYLFEQYTSNPSHPSTRVGERIDEAFWASSKDRSIDILSTKGVLPSKVVRMPAETLSFLGQVPMVPQELATGSVAFMMNLHNRGFISELTMEDIRKGLESRALNEDELIEFLKWCGSKLDSEEIDYAGVQNLFAVTVAAVSEDAEENSPGTIMQLASIESYVNVGKISATLPIPPETMPFKFTKVLPPKQMRMFGWKELAVERWLRHITTRPYLDEFTTSEKFATQVLSILAKAWDQLDGAAKEAVVSLLSAHAIMPTKMGMRRPEESYFSSVRLFDDLPTVKQFPGSKERFLQALGVRRTVDLPVVFEQLKARDTNNETGKAPWSHVDLIRYFASVIDEIPRKDMERLQQTAFLPGEGSTVKSGQLFKASDLYAPNSSLVALGLVQIKLPFEFRARTREGTLLLRLGLKQHPAALTVVNILQGAGQANDRKRYDLAMNYFLHNYFDNGYEKEREDLASLKIPYLPTEQAPFPTLVSPLQCFYNEHAACLDFLILRSDLRPHADKFGLRKDPHLPECAKRLIAQPPKSKADADIQFTYFASRSTELDQLRPLTAELSAAKIVPIFRKFYLDPESLGFEEKSKKQTGKAELRIHHYDPPETVFVGRDQEYRGILDYVNFGAEATQFLLKVGAKHEPNSLDLARLLIKNPSRFLNTIGQERYLDLLRKLAEHSDNLWKDKGLAKELVNSRVLLGYRDIKDENEKAVPVEDDAFEDNEPGVHREWSLNKATELVIVDDVQNFMRFRDYVVAAPQEETLEKFYERFGVKKISELVKVDRRVGNQLRDQGPAQTLRKDIVERSRLYLHECERNSSAKVVSHDAKWLNNHLTVQLVSDISITTTLLGINISMRNTRSAAKSKLGAGQYVLYITPKYDYYDVSRELISLLIKRPNQNDVIALERYFTESLKRLQQRGINVERILRKREYEARIAQQEELEKEDEEKQRRSEQAKRNPPAIEAPPETPEKQAQMPGAFGSPDGRDSLDIPRDGKGVGQNNNSIFSKFAKKWLQDDEQQPQQKPSSHRPTDGPQISRDVQSTRNNIRNAISECRPTNRQAIKSKHHQDATELEQGGYCSDQQIEDIAKAFSIPFQSRSVDIYLGKNVDVTPAQLQPHLSAFLPLIFTLTSVFGVNPAAVNIFHDTHSNTVAFNLSGALFFNMAWFVEVHWGAWATEEGRIRAMDSWFLTYCHELAHNIVSDHNARHGWFQSQIAIEFARGFRGVLPGLVGAGSAGK